MKSEQADLPNPCLEEEEEEEESQRKDKRKIKKEKIMIMLIKSEKNNKDLQTELINHIFLLHRLGVLQIVSCYCYI
jgi:hypothetical protein